MTNQDDTAGRDACGAHVCPHKMAWMLDNWLRRLFQNPGKIVGEYIREGDRVIDFGCGPGFLTIPMAVLAGESGRVTGADLQPEMLVHVQRKALAKNLEDRVSIHVCEKDRVGLAVQQKADFMVAFYMVHEVPDPATFFKEVVTLLKPGGKFLVVEPRNHVKKKLFDQMVNWAKDAGFTVAGFPKKKGGHAMLLTIEEYNSFLRQ